MLDKSNFCLIVDAMKENYDRIHSDLKKYNLYINIEKNPIDVMLVTLIDTNFNEHQAQIILDYAYPIYNRENISSAELYDDIMRLGDGE